MTTTRKEITNTAQKELTYAGDHQMQQRHVVVVVRQLIEKKGTMENEFYPLVAA